ncbi:MAG: helix-turn-helix transcriptional regulator [Promethearchaeia archaeon]
MKDLRTIRKELKLTQSDLAEFAGVSYVSISRIESGETVPRNDIRKKIEKSLNQRVNWLATCSLKKRRQGQMTSWEHSEQKLREALQEVYSLQKDERLDFIELANNYLETIEAEIRKEMIFDKLQQIKDGKKSFDILTQE